MERFDITKKHHRDVRLCKTRAFAAELFMESRWRDIARQWCNVAAMKENTALHNEKMERQLSELKALRKFLDELKS